MNNKSGIFEFNFSPQWNYSYFRLQLILSHPNIQIISVTKNPYITSNPLSQKQNFFKIDAALDITNQSIEIIDQLKKNIKKGTIFKCGRIYQDCNFNDSLGKQKIYRMMFFKIAVKQLLPIYKSTLITKQQLINFTQQYDSVYLANKKQQLSIYQHDYLLKSTSQYIWQYDIEYKYINANQQNSKVKKWNSSDYKCEQCNQNQAIWYCIDQKVLFCRECYQDIHRGRNRLMHKKQNISPFNCFKKCQKTAHNSKKLQFYCFLCKQLKCQKCLNDSVHSNTNNKFSLQQNLLNVRITQNEPIKKKSLHQSIQISKLIKLFKQKQFQLNNELKQNLTNKIKQIQGTIFLISLNYQNKQKIIQQKLKNEIIKLKQQSRYEINQAISIHTQLKRKFDQVIWIQKFIQYNQTVLDIQNNIQLKQTFTNYIEKLNASEYFYKVQQKIQKIKQNVG